MNATNANKAATHLGRTMQRDRKAHGWTLRDLAARTGIDYTTLSKVENGRRPFFEKLAVACDEQFSERRGWYLQYYDESKDWTPVGFRSWAEYEDKAVTLRAWSPSFLHGLLQTEDYARAQLQTDTPDNPEVVSARLAARMARQQRILFGPEPKLSSFVVDELSLYRCVGTPEDMAAQVRHLIRVARMPHASLQILPPVAHPVGASALVIADNTAAYAEHVLAGGVYTEPQTVTEALKLMTTIMAESYTASSSLKRLGRIEEIWTGVSQPSAAHKEATASRRPAAMA